jgi:hypothetical protein
MVRDGLLPSLQGAATGPCLERNATPPCSFEIHFSIFLPYTPEKIVQLNEIPRFLIV